MATLSIESQIRGFVKAKVPRRSIEATIGHAFTPEELEIYRKAVAIQTLQRAQKKAQGPKSVAERVAAHVARANELGDFNLTPRHPRLKDYCKYNLEAFGWYYCRQVLKHRAPEALRDGLIQDVQDAILNGGKFVKQYGRGGGKTTWVIHIATVWAILYGHRHYPVCISATVSAAKKNLKTIKYLLTRSKAIAQDFPEIAIPLAKIGDVSQRASSVTYHGAPVAAEWAKDRIILPMLRDSRGRPLGPGCGAIVETAGVVSAIRGANEVGQRPDFVTIDDPQTKKSAHSPKMVKDIIDFIYHDVFLLAGHDRAISIFVTITPQCFGDVATELSSSTKHPEWSVTVEPFLKRKCRGWDDLVFAFTEAYTEDAANKDTTFSRSRAWYLEHRDAFVDVVVIDPEQYDHTPIDDVTIEIDAVHHLLNLRAFLGEEAFNAEVMMQVASAESELSLSADLVASRVNGVPRGVLPMGTSAAFAFCDINLAKGKNLSWCVTAFGKGHVSAVVAYGKYPETGTLLRHGMSADAKSEAVALAIMAVARRIAALNLHDAEGRRLTVERLGFDCGYETAAVHRTVFRLNSMRSLPFPLIAVKGFGSKASEMKKNVVVKGDHWFELETKYKVRNRSNEVVSYRYLGSISPYWKEKAQSGFLETPLMHGSTSIFGSDPVKHFIFSTEICGELLVRKYNKEHHGRFETEWDWSVVGENHYLDALVGTFVLASRYGYYERTAKILERKFRTVQQSEDNGWIGEAPPEEIAPHPLHQDDLFDPSKNGAIAENTAYAPPKQVFESLANQHFINKIRKPVHKFKRGRFRR